MSSTLPDTQEQSIGQTTPEDSEAKAKAPTGRLILASSLQLILALIQLGLHFSIFTVTTATMLIPSRAETYSQSSDTSTTITPDIGIDSQLPPASLSTPPGDSHPTTPSPSMSHATLSPPSSPLTLPPPYEDRIGEEVPAADFVETDEHGWSRADLSMDGLDLTADEIQEHSGPARATDESFEVDSDQASFRSDDSSSSRVNRLSNQPKNPPLYQLILTAAREEMEYVEEVSYGCRYRTRGLLWYCARPSNSKKWYAVVKGTTLGVFDTWYVEYDRAWYHKLTFTPGLLLAA